MASTGTTAGDTPDLLKPLLESFQAARSAMQEEMEKDPVPDVSCDQILATTKWLKSVVQAMNKHNEGFSRLSLSTLNDDQLHRNQELARESSLQLTLLFADKSHTFTTTSQSQVMQFGMGSQSREIRDNLSNFSKFLEHFSQAKWLGDLIAPEFEEQKKLAVKILAELQTKTRVALPACSKPTLCSRCRQMTLKTKGFCDSCQRCAHSYIASSYPNGCPYGCNSSQDGLEYCRHCGHTVRKPSGFCSCGYCCHGRTAPCLDGCSTVGAKTISISARNAASIYAGVPCGNSSLAKLEGLVKMFQKAEVALRMDVKARKTAEKELEKKMNTLKDFAESVHEVPQVLRRFLLIRAGSIDDITQLKAWVGKEEADEVRKMLEAFRDDVNEEKVLRRLSRKRAASEGSWSFVPSPTPRR